MHMSLVLIPFASQSPSKLSVFLPLSGIMKVFYCIRHLVCWLAISEPNLACNNTGEETCQVFFLPVIMANHGAIWMLSKTCLTASDEALSSSTEYGNSTSQWERLFIILLHSQHLHRKNKEILHYNRYVMLSGATIVWWFCRLSFVLSCSLSLCYIKKENERVR